MRDKPWAVVDLMDPDAEIKWYHTDTEAWLDNRGKAVDVQWRPGHKKRVKK